MRNRAAGTSFLLLLLPAFLVSSVILCVNSPPAGSAELTFSSRTYGLLFEREYAGGKEERYAPLFEYLSADASDIGGKPVFLRFSGWGRFDLGDDYGSDGASGEISSLYLEYLHPEGNGQARLGRFFLTEGVASDTIDGAFFKVMSRWNVGIALWGGIPVEYPIWDNADRGDALYGGRIFYVRSGLLEAGFSYLKEEGAGDIPDRELIGGDLWMQLYKGVELNGEAAYDDDAGKMATQRYALRYVPSSTIDVTAGYEYYTYEGLFRYSLHPAFRPPATDNNDKVGKIFGVVAWTFTPRWTLEVVGKNIHHDRGEAVDANRGEIGVRYQFNEGRDIAGGSVAATFADGKENDYSEYRAFATYSPGKLRLTLDAIAQLFRAAASNDQNTYQVVATAGYQILSALQLSGTVVYTKSPLFEEDLTGVIRLSYDLAVRTGGKK